MSSNGHYKECSKITIVEYKERKYGKKCIRFSTRPLKFVGKIKIVLKKVQEKVKNFGNEQN